MKILCLTGTNPYSFERLVSAVDNDLGKKHEVHIQLGNTNYNCKFSKTFDFCSREEILKQISNSDIIITQGGFGSISDALSFGKKIIAVPRLIDLNECQDNQIEIVDYYAKKNFLVPCYDVNNLMKFVSDLTNGNIKLANHIPETDIKISDIISKYLNSI